LSSHPGNFQKRQKGVADTGEPGCFFLTVLIHGEATNRMLLTMILKFLIDDFLLEKQVSFNLFYLQYLIIDSR